MRCALLIPTYSAHLQYISHLVASIDMQSRLPDAVYISASSITDISHNSALDTLLAAPRPYLLEILRTPEKQTAAENRNALLRYCRNLPRAPEILSFIDSDDWMHPRRLELICNTFETTNVDVVLHSFVYSTEPALDTLDSTNIYINTHELYHEPVYEYTTQTMKPFYRVKMCTSDGEECRVSFGHASLRVATTTPFEFHDTIARTEDAVFIAELARANRNFGYVHAPLSTYRLH